MKHGHVAQKDYNVVFSLANNRPDINQDTFAFLLFEISPRITRMILELLTSTGRYPSPRSHFDRDKSRSA